jgi:hypothetical protein
VFETVSRWAAIAKTEENLEGWREETTTEKSEMAMEEIVVAKERRPL